jgi:hypothetical protein
MDDDVATKLQERATAAIKQRRYRERQKLGRGCLTIETDLAGLADVLRDAGVISPLAEDDPAILARGLEDLIERLKRHGYA